MKKIILSLFKSDNLILCFIKRCLLFLLGNRIPFHVRTNSVLLRFSIRAKRGNVIHAEWGRGISTSNYMCYR